MPKLLTAGGSTGIGNAALEASAAEIDRATDVSARIVTVTDTTLSITEEDHEGKTIVQDNAAGCTMTLPAATGSGGRYRILCKTTITSNSLKVQVADATDVMQGHALLGQDAADTAVLFEAASTSDTITGNGTTTGGLKGQIIELEDIAANLWQVRVEGAATGTEATPFSAAVS